MVSLHVDTARTWRGGQNQVLLTVRGLRARGHEATIIAHPDGELRRRLQETDELIPLTPRTEMDVLAGWKLAQLIQERQPDILHVHDAHAVAVAALAISFIRTSIPTRVVASRRVIFQLGQNMFSRWKYRRVDRFIFHPGDTSQRRYPVETTRCRLRRRGLSEFGRGSASQPA